MENIDLIRIILTIQRRIECTILLFVSKPFRHTRFDVKLIENESEINSVNSISKNITPLAFINFDNLRVILSHVHVLLLDTSMPLASGVYHRCINLPHCCLLYLRLVEQSQAQSPY